MEIKTEQKQKDYLKTLHFNIKDFYSTSLKYSDYKDKEFKQFLESNKEEILNFLENLNEQIFNLIINDYKNYRRIEFLNFKKKMDIRHLKTVINGETQNLINTFVIDNFQNIKMNNNTLRCFKIKFYLKCYDVINEEMKTALNEIVEHQTQDF